MFSKKFFKIFFGVLASGFMIFSFQNCNKVQPGVLASNLDSTAMSLNEDVQLLPQTPGVDEASLEADDSSLDPSQTVNTQVQTPSDVTIDTEELPMETAVVITTASQPTVDNKPPSNLTSPVESGPVATVSENENENVVTEDEKNSAVAWCQAEQKNSKVLELKHESATKLVNGSHIIKSEDKNIRKIKQILRINGSQVICSLDIEHIGRSNGKIILVDSEVDRWDDHRGNMILINSRVKNLAKAEGKLKKCAK